MRTHIVGTRKPAPLGAYKPTTKKQPPANPNPNATQYAVVSKGFATTMQGGKANRSKSGKGTMYALFSTYAQAYQHINANHMRLYASIVAW